LYTPRMPRTGAPMSVQMTNCGALGWLTDQAHGYRYTPAHPETGQPWPPIPQLLLDLWDEFAAYRAPPEACLVNVYRDGAREPHHFGVRQGALHPLRRKGEDSGHDHLPTSFPGVVLQGDAALVPNGCSFDPGDCRCASQRFRRVSEPLGAQHVDVARIDDAWVAGEELGHARKHLLGRFGGGHGDDQALLKGVGDVLVLPAPRQSPALAAVEDGEDMHAAFDQHGLGALQDRGFDDQLELAAAMGLHGRLPIRGQLAPRRNTAGCRSRY
ncbi:MAG: hypothetical protein EBZ50_13380, partial [Alphaproteobacteria bacterium]|nr:hypothetical protein [Alphaproteobacteria bacterium]